MPKKEDLDVFKAKNIDEVKKFIDKPFDDDEGSVLQVDKDTINILNKPHGKKLVKYYEYEKKMIEDYIKKQKARQGEKNMVDNNKINNVSEKEDVNNKDKEKIVLNSDDLKALREKGVVITEEEYERELESKMNEEKRPDDDTDEIKEVIESEIKKNKGVEIVRMKNTLFLISELPLFKIEPIILIAGFFISCIIGLLAFLNVINPIMLIVPLAIMSIIPLSIMAYKRMFFLPNKTRRLIVRFFKNGLGMLSCEPLYLGNKVKFSEDSEPTVVTNMRAHTELFSGHPLILAFEGYFENLNLSKIMSGKINERTSNKVIAILDEANALGVKKERLKNMKVEQAKNSPIMLIAIIVVAILLIASIFMFFSPMLDTMKAVKTSVDAMSGSIDKLLKASVVSGVVYDANTSSGQIVNVDKAR